MGRVFLKVVAAAEVLGAVAACVRLANDLPDYVPHLGSSLALVVTLCGLLAIYVLTGVAGIALWRGRPWGLLLSAVAQLAQVPQLEGQPVAYKLLLGPSAVLKVQPGTWLLSFEVDFGTVDYTVSWAHQGSTIVGLNVLAAWLALHLLRQRSQALRPGPPVPVVPWPRRWLRALGRWLLIAGSVVTVPVLAVWVCNRFDEAPTPAALRWFAPIVHASPEAGTGWLYRLGMGAAEGDDPVAFGRQRLAAYEARVADPSATQSSAAEKALETSPLPFNWAPEGGARIDLECDTLQRDCLAWARDHAAHLARLAAANAVRVRRYEVLLELQHFEDLSTPTLDAPFPPIRIDDALHRALTLRDLADPARRGIGLQRLQRAMAFWQRNIDSGASAITGRLAEQAMERELRVLDALVSRLDPRELDALLPQLAPLLQTVAPARERWEPVLRRQAKEFERIMLRTRAGVINALWACRSHCLRDWAIGQFVVPQATRNRAAPLSDALLAEHLADPRDHATAQQAVQALVQSYNPFSDDLGEMLRKLSYNYSGDALVAIWVPAYGDMLHLQHDLNDLRRLLRLKIAARQQRVRAEQMPAFLARQPIELRHGFTGQAYRWDAATRQIRFEPRSRIWKRQHLAVALP